MESFVVRGHVAGPGPEHGAQRRAVRKGRQTAGPVVRPGGGGTGGGSWVQLEPWKVLGTERLDLGSALQRSVCLFYGDGSWGWAGPQSAGLQVVQGLSQDGGLARMRAGGKERRTNVQCILEVG